MIVVNVFDLAAKLTLDSSEYERGLSGAKGMATAVGKGIKTAFAVGTAAIGAATTATIAFGKSAVDAGLTFDSTMSKVAAISGATGDEFNALRNEAQKMGATTKFSATESAEALTYMAMAGWDTGDMLNGLEGIMSLAAASGEDLAATSDIVTDALTAFGLKAADAGKFADILAAASSNANTNVALMGETFKYVAPAAGALGYTAEDVATAIGLMANAGIKGSQAGTALRSVLTRLAKPTKESEKAMAALGLSLTDSSGNMKSFKEIMVDLRNGFQDELVISVEEFDAALRDLNESLESGKITESEYDEALESLAERAYGAKGALMAQYAAMLGGQEAMSGLLAIVNASDEDFQKLTDSIYGAEGAAKAMADTMQDNLLGDITIFKSALEGAKIALSDRLTPAIRDFVKFGSEGISRLTQAFNKDGFNGAMAELGDILSEGIGKLAEELPGMFESGSKLLESLGKGILDNLPTLTNVAVQIITTIGEKIVTALPQLTSASMQILTGLLNGITESLKDSKSVQLIIDSALGIAQAFVDNLPDLLDAGLEFLIALIDGMVKAIPDALPKITGIILGIVNALTDPERSSKMVDASIALLTALADGLIKSIDVLLKKSPEIVENLVQSLVDNSDKMIEAGFALTEKVADGVTDPNVLSKLYKSGTSICYSIAKGVDSLVDSLFHTQVPKSITLGVSSGISEMLGGVRESGIQIAQKILEGIKTFDVISWGKKIVNDIHNGISTWIQNVYDSGKLIIQNIRDGINTLGPIEWGKKVITDFVKGIDEWIKDAFDAGKRIINNVWEGIKNLDPVSWGRDLINNFTSGISQAWSTSGSGTISSIASGIKKLIGFSEPDEGPLSDFHTYAPDMMALFAQGIRDNQYLVDDAISKAFNFEPKIRAGFDASGNYIGRYDDEPQTIIVQSVLDGRIIGETSYEYARNRRRMVGA